MMTHDTAYDRYIKDISHYERISKERETKLCKVISKRKNKEQVEAAIDELVNANLRLVIHCVKSFTSFINSSRTTITVMDLIAEGNLSLVKAAQNFNPSYQTGEHSEPIRFSAYACKCIKNAMRKAFRKARFIHIPDHHYGYWKRIKELTDEHSEDLSDDMLQEKLDIGASRLETIKQGLQSSTVMLEDIVYEDGESHWSDFIPNENAVNPHEETGTSDLRAYLTKQLHVLPPRTREMISLMFLSEHKPTLHDLSMRFGVSKERCRQVCARGLQLLRKEMQSTWDHVEHVEAFATINPAASEEEELVYFPPAMKNLSVA